MAPGRPAIAALVLPLFIELALGMLVFMAGTALAARLSDTAGAGFSMAHHVFGMLFMMFRWVGAGVSVVMAQNLGAGQRDEADRVARAALAAGSWMGGATALLALLASEPLLRLLNAPDEVRALARPFLQSLAPALLLDAWNACLAGVMRAHLRNRDALRVTLLMHLTHLALLWPLMLGADAGWTGWGLPGYALALTLSRLAGLGLNLHLWRRRLGLRPQAGDWWRLRAAQLRPVGRIGLPGVAENMAWELGFMASVAAVGVMGTQALATQAYVMQFNMWILISSAAIGIAIEILVGHLVGARRLREAHDLVGRSLAYGLLLSLSGALLLAWWGPALLRLFTREPEILALGARLMWWSILLETGRTFNLVVIAALRATGDARYPFYAGCGIMALVLAGGSWVLGLGLGMGLTGVWLAYAADEWVRGLLMWRRWRTQGWVPQARATHQRMVRQKTRRDETVAAP